MEWIQRILSLLTMDWVKNRVLKSYLKTEEGRVKLHQMMQENVNLTYNEQSVPGNLYNGFTEFIISNKVLRKAVKDKDSQMVDMLQRGLLKEYYRSLKMIRDEKMYEDEC